MKTKFIVFSVLFFLTNIYNINAQRVGLVMSGGGAKGLAHIGVLKALEENDIPVDYIVGTSMGGIVGGFYAAGYSPKEIEKIALTSDFQNWVNGKLSEGFKYFYSKPDENPSWLSIKMFIDTSFRAKFEPDLINDVPMNFALTEYLAQSSARSGYDFNNLVVPFRCLAADIFTQEQIIIRDGSLCTALRATLSVPFFFRPIKIKNKYLYDGGVYNNFPVDVIKKEFSPEVIIGSNVSSKTYKSYPYHEDENLLSQSALYLILSKSDSTNIDSSGIYIQPDLRDYSSLDFRYVKEMIQSGYEETIKKIPQIKARITRRIDKEALFCKRESLLKDIETIRVSSLQLSGLEEKQENYVKKLFNLGEKPLSIFQLKKNYYKLATDDNYQVLLPDIRSDSLSKNYKLQLLMKRDKNLGVEIGGNIASRSIHELFIGLRYTYLRRKLYNFQFNLFTGRFYQSFQFKNRISFPISYPFYIEPEITYNYWNYLETSDLLTANSRPTIIRQNDQRIILNAGFAINNKGKIVLSGGYFNNQDFYNEKSGFNSTDTLDNTQFEGQTFSFAYTTSTLNRKQYASQGGAFLLSFRYVNGEERFTVGSKSDFLKNNFQYHNWLKIKLRSENYYGRGKYRYGYLFEGVLSNQDNFLNLRSTQIAAPAFYPINDSKSLFLDNLRAFNYLSAGIRNVFEVKRKVDVRLEGYGFLPFENISIANTYNFNLETLKTKNILYAGTLGLVYHSFIGPISASLNYYDKTNKPFGFLFHIGFLLYQSRSLD